MREIRPTGHGDSGATITVCGNCGSVLCWQNVVNCEDRGNPREVPASQSFIDDLDEDLCETQGGPDPHLWGEDIATKGEDDE